MIAVNEQVHVGAAGTESGSTGGWFGGKWMTSYQRDMVLSELIDIVGREDVCTAEPDRFVYALDLTGLLRCGDRGRSRSCPISDCATQDNRKRYRRILQLANTHRLPVIPWRWIGLTGWGHCHLWGITLDTKN